MCEPFNLTKRLDTRYLKQSPQQASPSSAGQSSTCAATTTSTPYDEFHLNEDLAEGLDWVRTILL
jgi:hypothetical protein